MICPECNHNQKYSDGMTCQKCKYRFVFNPKTDKTNDFKFSKAIKSVSADGSAHFTFRQFYAEFTKLNGFKISNHMGALLTAMIIGGLAGHVVFDAVPITIGIVAATLIVGYIVLRSTYQLPAYTQVEKLFLRWSQKNKQNLKGLLYEPSLQNPPPTPVDHDIFDYGVEAIIIVDKDIYVDLFVLNNMHVDLKALVMSKTGYPNYLLSQTKQMLKDNPETPVFVFHDGSEGKGMVDEAKKFYDIQDRNVIDLGLFPEDFHQIKRLRKFKEIPNQPLDLFSKNEMVNLLSISIRDQVTIAASAAMVYPNDDPSYGSFG